MYPAGFKGRAKRLTDIDVARVGRLISVGEDEVRAVIEVETAGGGFDKLGRPKMLFEPHRLWIELGEGTKRTMAAEQGLAYPKWGYQTLPERQLSAPRIGHHDRCIGRAALLQLGPRPDPRQQPQGRRLCLAGRHGGRVL